MTTVLPEDRSRFSIGFLVSEFVNAATGEVGYFGLYSGWAARRGIQNQYSAFGGAAHLTEFGMEVIAYVKGSLENPQKRNARCLVPPGTLHYLAQRFRGQPELLEPSIIRELEEELCGDELGKGPIMTLAQLERIEMIPLGWATMNGSPVLRPDLQGRVRAHNDVSERIFKGYRLMVPEDVWAALLAHPAVRRFTEAEVEQTQGGLFAVESKTPGVRIGENMLLPSEYE